MALMSQILEGRKRTLTATMFGGLGNQMFIYAFARALALAAQRELVLDVDSFQGDRTYGREFLLDRLRIAGSIKPIAPLTRRRRIWRAITRRYNHRLPLRYRTMLVEDKMPGFQPKLMAADYRAGDVVVEGYWQTEKYFAHLADRLREELRCEPELDADAQRELALIRAAPVPVAIGLRFFREVPGFKSGLPAKKQQLLARIGRIFGRRPEVRLFVFTEEPQLVREMLGDEIAYTPITHRPANRDAFQNLFLMNHCAEYLVGVSSYHWWGAWLSRAPQPRIYATQDEIPPNRDYFPDTWTKTD